MPDLTPVDLGNGYKLNYQKDGKGNVRAVIKDAGGNIVVTGKTVPEEQAFASRFNALASAAWLNKVQPEMQEGPFDEDELDEGTDDEDEEEEY